MSPQKYILCFIGLALILQTHAPVFAEATTKLKSYYSPILKLEANNGYFLISSDSGIQWIQVEENAKPHLKTLKVGDMIDVVVQFRPDNVPPLLKSWKLANSSSSCKIFDGKICTQ